MSRPTMSTLIAEVRSMTGAGTADWTDDQVQRFLDRGRTDHWRATIQGRPLQEPGSVTYRVFDAPAPLEGGSVDFYLTEAGGGTIDPAGYVVDYDTGLITFTASRESEVYLTARQYDPAGAGADLLDQWAAALSVDSWDVAQDQQTLSRSQRVKSMQDAARALRRRSSGGGGAVPMVRRDG